LDTYHECNLKMSGGEYYSLVSWLMANGHPDIEDSLLKFKLLGDKKYHLVKYMREKCAHLAPGGAEPPMPPQAMPQQAMPQQAPEVIGNAQILRLNAGVMPEGSAPPSVLAAASIPAAPPQVSAQSAMEGVVQPAALQSAAILQAVATIQQAAPVAHGSSAVMVKALAELEGTVHRLEESFNFAVECVQSDLANAKQQIAQLKAHLPGA